MEHERRWRSKGTRRLAVLGPLALAGAMILGSGATTAHEGETGTPQASGGGPSIAVTGTGEASAPAEGVLIQIVVRRNDVGMASDATPAVKAFAAGRRAPLTEAEIAPVIDALVATGIPVETIEVVIAPAAPFTGAFGPGTAQILTSGDQAVVARLGEVIPPVIEAALAANLLVDQAGVGYTVADCVAVETAALRDAVENGAGPGAATGRGTPRAARRVRLASRQPSYGTYGSPGGGACAEPLTADSIKEGAVYLAPFIAGSGTEFSIYATVSRPTRSPNRFRPRRRIVAAAAAALHRRIGTYEWCRKEWMRCRGYVCPNRSCAVR